MDAERRRMAKNRREISVIQMDQNSGENGPKICEDK